MLYDKRWDKPVKADTFSVAGLIAWLETQSPEQEYNWSDIDGCVLCNYLRAVTGVSRPAGTYWVNKTGGLGRNTLGPDWGYWEICQTLPWTYGAALTRARALLP